MSFYDNIQISPSQLPLSETERQQFGEKIAHCQTQSLEGMYAAYIITESGHLERGGIQWKGSNQGRAETARLVDAHGFVVLYTVINNECFYFKARFREGRMIQLFRLHQQEETHSRTCTWELEIPVSELKPVCDTEIIRHELSLLDAREQHHLEDEFADFDQRFCGE